MTMETMETMEQQSENTDLKPKDTSHAKEISERFTDNGGSYDMVVKKMLNDGHEGELCLWLKEVSLIRSDMNCLTESCNGKSLTWQPSRVVDKYCWYCTNCKKKQFIRDSSFFLQIKCELKICMQIIVAWCQFTPSEVVVSYLGLKHFVVRKTYEKLAKVAELYVVNHINEWILGGPDKIIIIDEYPSGYMTETLINAPVTKRRNNNNCHTILCMAEVKDIPPRMWMHIMNANPESISPKNAKNQKQATKCGMVEEALKEICAHAKPGSYLIANKKARCCNYESLKELKDYKVVSLEGLQTHDTPGKNELLNNIETIWQTGIEVCEDIQDTTRAQGLQFFYLHLWRQRFATTPASAFEHIIQHIAECFPFT
ncbi:uncharacterized protein LOC106635802 isoform X2 [Copidosoma floridanum]|uniref:uncharacterized protein LOC106635802 isoform X2 n=1 Tax=Copidosoma floridanum TaxID=29053 RepID=UPI000C6FAA71|nr:uncharacterized protein LOC106635802 isoform X2 [Copidosoma floridanum]